MIGLIVFLLVFVVVIFFLGNLEIGNFSDKEANHGKFIKVSGEQIRYFQKGEGNDVLLVHGTPGSLEDWQPLVDSLARSHRVTAFDRPGHGYSTANQVDYSLGGNAMVINELIEKLRLEEVVLMGHSYGGLIAAHLAVNPNPKIKSCVLVAAPFYDVEVNGMLKLTSMSLLGKGFCVLLAKTVGLKMMEQVIIELFNGKRDKVSDEFIDFRKKMWAQPKVIYAMSKEIVLVQENLMEMTAKYAGIKIPVTIVVGDEDKNTILEDSKRAQAVIPNSKLVIFEKTAHYVQYERAAALGAIIKEV